MGLRRYGWNLALAVDLLGSAITGGSARETISSRLGRWALKRMKEGRWPPPWYHPLRWLERGLNAIDPNHVFDAVDARFDEDMVIWRINTPR